MPRVARLRHDRHMNGTADRIVDDLVRADLLDPALRARAREVVQGGLQPAPDSASAARGLPKLVEVVAYLGGALVLAAATLFLATSWESLTFGSRMAVLAVATAVLLLAGFVAARVPTGARLLDPSYDVRRRLAGSLLSGAALTAALLTGHLVDRALEPTTTRLDWVTLSAGAVALVVAGGGYVRAATAVGVLALMGSLLIVVLTLTGDVADAVAVGTEGDVTGVLVLMTGVLWLVVTDLGVLREQVVARVVGAGVALVGAQVPVIDGHDWLGYLMTAGLVVVGVAMYLGRQAWPYLALSVIGVTLVVPEAVSDWTEGSLGVVGGVLVTGMTLLAASFAGYRLREEAVD